MALLNEILVGRFSRMLQRFTGIKNAQAAVPQLAPEIQPGFDMSNMPPEIRWLGTERLAQFGGTTPAGAGTFSYAQVSCPFGSNLMVILESIIVTNLAGAATEFDVALSSQSTRAALPAQVRDIRANPTFGAFGVTARCCHGLDATGDGVAMLANSIRFNLPAAPSAPFVLELPIVVCPSLTTGRAITIKAVQANQAFDVGFLFRERYIEESERE